MGGSPDPTPVVSILLLFYTLTTSAPVNEFGYYPHDSACEAGTFQGPQYGLFSKCHISPDNRDVALEQIRQDGIKALYIVITDGYQDFVFVNESFSKDLESLTIYAYYPFLIPSGAFRRSERIHSLMFYQKYDLLPMVNKSMAMSGGQMHWTSLKFETGWLMPITGLKQLNLSHNSIERFPDMQFCHLKELQHLDLSTNKINSSEGLGITCNSSKGPCAPCLPNVTHLSIANNPITVFNINISDNLQSLNISGCSLRSINLDKVMSNNIQVIDMSHNKLSSLIMDVQGNCNASQLSKLYLQYNKLHIIPAGFFTCVEYLKYLDLSRNQLNESTLISGGLNQVTELELLNLSYNKLPTLHGGLIGNMTKLLHFSCSSCRLINIQNNTFNKLKSLKSLGLDRNKLLFIDDSTFIHLQLLNSLDLSNNLLSTIPCFSHPQPDLHTLVLDRNNISTLHVGGFKGLSNLKVLSIAFNQINHITQYDFQNMHSLQALHINDNKIQYINYYCLDDLPNLKTLRLNNNYLKSADPLKLNLHILENVDLSNNRLNYVNLEASETLKSIDLSINNIKYVGPVSQFNNLRVMNLTHNNLRKLSEDVFLTNTQPRPQVLLQGNPLHCDCQLEWLLNTKFTRSYEKKNKRRFPMENNKNTKPYQRINYVDMKRLPPLKRFYAEVPDLDLLQCQTSGSGSNMTSFIRADFLCPYQEECTDWGCYEDCCTQDPDCPCRGVCYPDCSCYHKNNHKVDFMNCTSRNVTSLPRKRPVYAKQIFLDGNNLTNLNSDYLDFPKLTELFVNKSNVFSIHAGTFEKLKMLEVLDLHQNYIEKIDSNTFRNVFNLKQLYLQENKINSIANDSFLNLTQLRILRLHGNNLMHLNLALFEDMNVLTELTLHDNPWFCDCNTGPVFKKWLITHYKIVTDIEHIYCMNYTNYTTWDNELNRPNTRGNASGFITTSQLKGPLIHVDFSYICKNATFRMTTEYKYIKSITEVTSLAAAFGVFMLIVIVVYKNLLLIKVWVYNRFSVRLHREENDNDEKPYDLFVTYPRQDEDERFVVQHLLPELEVGNKSYRICLEGRDWPPGADKSETIIASVQQSKRTILLVSEHHFNTQWCEFSFEAAHYQVLMDKQIRLIIILTDRNLEARMNRTMKMYMRSNAFLVVGEKWFWKKLRYYLADNPRGADDEVGREFRLMKVYNNQGH